MRSDYLENIIIKNSILIERREEVYREVNRDRSKYTNFKLVYF